jgi:hypothetical protein
MCPENDQVPQRQISCDSSFSEEKEAKRLLFLRRPLDRGPTPKKWGRNVASAQE